MDERIKNILAAIFFMDAKDVGDDASPETVEVWDSLKHMNIVLALEDEFGIRFEDDEIVELMSYKGIRKLVQFKLNA
ncbi:MAG: acyl carrier protein [Methylococcaceae bacterium]